MSEPVKALIAVKSTERRDALHALLASIERIDTIDQANDVQTTIEMIEAGCPALILVDFSLFSAIASRCNATTIALVTDRAEQVRARTAGATHVFIEGTPVSQLVAAIEALLDVGNGQ